MRKWLVEARGKRTQKEIAEAAGIAQSTYASIELGTRDPSVKVAKQLAVVLGVVWTRFYEEVRKTNG